MSKTPDVITNAKTPRKTQKNRGSRTPQKHEGIRDGLMGLEVKALSMLFEHWANPSEVSRRRRVWQQRLPVLRGAIQQGLELEGSKDIAQQSPNRRGPKGEQFPRDLVKDEYSVALGAAQWLKKHRPKLDCDIEGWLGTATIPFELRIRARITCSFGTAVILSAAKNLAVIAGEILRCAQDDDKENCQVISARILTNKRIVERPCPYPAKRLRELASDLWSSSLVPAEVAFRIVATRFARISERTVEEYRSKKSRASAARSPAQRLLASVYLDYCSFPFSKGRFTLQVGMLDALHYSGYEPRLLYYLVQVGHKVPNKISTNFMSKEGVLAICAQLSSNRRGGPFSSAFL